MDFYIQKPWRRIFFAALILLHFIAVTAYAAQTDPSLVGTWSLRPNNLPFFPVHVHVLPVLVRGQWLATAAKGETMEVR